MRTLLLLCLVSGLAVQAGDFERDRQAILAMVGAHMVDFHFEETVSFQIGYDLKPAYDAAGLEAVILLEDSSDKIVLQHVLQTSHGIVKHWRQDWEYQPRDLWAFQGNRVWERQTLDEKDVAGAWVQRVYQVDDSLRYEAIGRWQHIGNLSQWTSAETQRPLPRREHTKRDDYNIMVAVNRHAINTTGWVHEQDNYKLRRDENGDHVIAREFGRNSYDRTHGHKLAEAKTWWEEHAQAWADVRAVWTEVLADRREIAFTGTVDDKPMVAHLFAATREATEAETYDAVVLRERVRAIIDSFLIPVEDAKLASISSD